MRKSILAAVMLIVLVGGAVFSSGNRLHTKKVVDTSTELTT